MVADAVAAIPPTKDADMADVERMVAAKVAEAASDIEAKGASAAAAYAEACEKAEGAAARLVEAEAKAREAREASLQEFTDLTAGLAKVERRCEAIEQAVEPVAKAIVAEAVAAIPVPKDFDPDTLPPLVAAEVEKAVSALPKPQDGHTPTAAELDALIEPHVSKAVSVAVAGIPIPKDGCGIKELLIDREGALVATMDDGRLKSLGVVVGRNGADVDIGDLVDWFALDRPAGPTGEVDGHPCADQLQRPGRSHGIRRRPNHPARAGKRPQRRNRCHD